MPISLFGIPFVPLMQVTARELIFSEIWISERRQHQVTHTHTGVQGGTLPCNVLYGDTFGECSGLLWSPVAEGGGDSAFIRSEDGRAWALLGLRAWNGKVGEQSAHANTWTTAHWHDGDLKGPRLWNSLPFLSRIMPRGCQQSEQPEEGKAWTPVRNSLHYAWNTQVGPPETQEGNWI